MPRSSSLNKENEKNEKQSLVTNENIEEGWISVQDVLDELEQAYFQKWNLIQTQWKSMMKDPKITQSLCLNSVLNKELDIKLHEQSLFSKYFSAISDSILTNSDNVGTAGIISYVALLDPTMAGMTTYAVPFLTPKVLRWFLASRVQSGRLLSFIIGALKGLLFD